jgi:ADP-ribose pyrophosphatase YjhB (NUDIX family)
MPTRVEYFDDPNAPRANSLVVAVTAVVVDEAGNILLQKRTDNDLCGLPGGAMNIGESIAQAVVREVKEETALDDVQTGLVGIYSDPGHVIAYADGEVRQEFSICFKARVVGGELSVADRESTEVRFVSPGGPRPAADESLDSTADPAFPRGPRAAVSLLTVRQPSTTGVGVLDGPRLPESIRVRIGGSPIFMNGNSSPCGSSRRILGSSPDGLGASTRGWTTLPSRATYFGFDTFISWPTEICYGSGWLVVLRTTDQS